MKTIGQSIVMVCITLFVAGVNISCKKNSDDELPAEVPYKMVLTTDKAEGEKIRLSFEAATADQADIFIDLNNNRQKDAGEEVGFGYSINYTVNASRKFTIYGKVTTLDCNNNSLTRLEVSGNSALKILHCGSNKLTTLDLSGCTVLGEVHCWLNQLSTLNFTANKDMYIVSCYENQLKSAAVTTMINSLPVRTTDASMYLFNTQVATEGNTLATGANITTANSKKWKLYQHKNFMWELIPN
jgi:hypothetical protein